MDKQTQEVVGSVEVFFVLVERKDALLLGHQLKKKVSWLLLSHSELVGFRPMI